MPRRSSTISEGRGIWPGLNLKVDGGLGINPQLFDRIREFEGLSGVEIWQEYSALLEGKTPSTLYVAIVRPSTDWLNKTSSQDWQTLPAIIRTLPKDRNRLAYLKAWQVLSGAITESTKALDVNEVARYLRELNGV